VATIYEVTGGYSWESLRRDWNRAYGDYSDDGTGRSWRYDSASNFIRDAKTALERLLYPGWTNSS
jgi:hypothetical protein